MTGRVRACPRWCSLWVPSREGRRSGAEGEPADSDPLGLEDDDAALVEVPCDGGKVPKQERRLLLGSALGAPPEEDHGRALLAAGREERGEVGVGGDENAVFSGARSKISTSLAACRP